MVLGASEGQGWEARREADADADDVEEVIGPCA